MIKKQFTKGGKIDLNGMTISTARESNSGNAHCGLIFPKVKALNVTVKVYIYSKNIGGSENRGYVTSNGKTVQNGTVRVGYSAGSVRENTFTITDGRIMESIGFAYDPQKGIVQVSVIFNQVEMVE